MSILYLKKVQVLLEYEDRRAEFAALADRLAPAGIACEIKRIGTEFPGSEASDDHCADRNILRITDSPALAARLLEKELPLLVFLHAENQDCPFPGCLYACEDPAALDAVYLDRIFRRFLRIPWDILETERCLIRETTVEDVDAFYSIYKEPSVTKYMEPLYEDPAKERAYAQDYIDKVYRFYEFGIWTVVEKNAREVIGRAGICCREGYEDPEIGFLIAVPYQRKGYATEVCRAILKYAKQDLGFRRILAFVKPDNTVSLHLCAKLGMTIQGRVCLRDGEYTMLSG